MFSWMSGRSRESNLPPPTALQAQREAQIQQLKIFNQNVSEIQRDIEYLVKCTINATTISLHITLPAEFPQEKPTVRVSPPLSHPWVNDNMIVTGCPGINNFMVHSDLGKVIREIVEEFRRKSPFLHVQPIIPAPRYASPSVPSDYSGGVPLSHHGYPGPSQFTAPVIDSHVESDVPDEFPHLHDMTLRDLTEVSEDEDRQMEIVKQLPEIMQLTAIRDELCGRNEDLARENLSKRPIFDERKKCVLEKFDVLNDLRRQFDENSHRQEGLRQQYSDSNLQDILRIAAVEADETSETIAESFLDEKLQLNDFLKKFMESKTLAHLRRAKAEKMLQHAVTTRTTIS